MDQKELSELIEKFVISAQEISSIYRNEFGLERGDVYCFCRKILAGNDLQTIMIKDQLDRALITDSSEGDIDTVLLDLLEKAQKLYGHSTSIVLMVKKYHLASNL